MGCFAVLLFETLVPKNVSLRGRGPQDHLSETVALKGRLEEQRRVLENGVLLLGFFLGFLRVFL